MPFVLYKSEKYKKNVSIEMVNINIIKNLLCMLGAGRGEKRELLKFVMFTSGLQNNSRSNSLSSPAGLM